jgi:aspartyl-tRNA(Asn)/glutamyl-tRNA(Gln) amidotransferase subunit C
MSHFDEKEFSKLTKLCRIECSQEEKEKLFANVSRILSYVAQLDELDTQNVMPCNHVIETMSNVMREDEIGETLSREEFLANAPSHVGGMIKVPSVIKMSNP